MPAPPDPCSQSDPEAARVTHVQLDWVVDFEGKAIRGKARYTVACAETAGRVVLDTRCIEVRAVTCGGGALAFELQPVLKEHVGAALVIELPPDRGDQGECVVTVEYSTTPAGTAIQWLAPEQTAGGKHPYLFTQCQAIHARALLPCQDTPRAKMTYTATVSVPEELTAVMSGVPEGEPTADGGGTRSFRFKQAVPVPPYLVALAVGDLVKRDLGPRSCVWSEPSMVEAGVYEFAETNAYLEAAERIVGNYVWGRYDLLLLPPSFPFGGMENPCLTFVTPTLLAGDRSQANVVAHEIAHSWFGNLVTNASWESFWLNEGFTVFLERKILRAIFGDAVADFHSLQGLVDLKDDVTRFEQDGSAQYTRLELDLSHGDDPDEAYSKVPYEKGCAFLSYLERQVGGPSVFEPFLRDYIKVYGYKTVSTDQFRAMYTERFASKPEVADIDWDAWLHGEGMPPVDTAPYYDSSLLDASNELANKWHFCDVMGVGTPDRPADAKPEDVAGWTSNQLCAFLDRLIELRVATPLAVATVKALDALYKFSESGNNEIKCSYNRLAIDAGDADALPSTRAMLLSQGRMKYLKPLYRSLLRSRGAGFRQVALATFATARSGYHPIAAGVLASLLNVP